MTGSLIVRFSLDLFAGDGDDLLTALEIDGISRRQLRRTNGDAIPGDIARCARREPARR